MELDPYTRKRLRGRKYGYSAPFTALDVWEKSRGICGICDRPIDPEITWPNPESFVVDHIESRIGKYGDDVLENAQAAHRRCNSKKAGLVDRSGLWSRQMPKREVLTARVDPAISAAVTQFSLTTNAPVNSIVSTAVYQFLNSHDHVSGSTAISYAAARAVDDLSQNSQYAEAIARLSGDSKTFAQDQQQYVDEHERRVLLDRGQSAINALSGKPEEEEPHA